MAKKTTNEEKEIEVGAIVSRSEQFIEKHKKSIIAAIVGIAAVVGLVLVYHYMYAKPQTEKAKLAIFKGEQYLAQDSFALALNGNGVDYDGFDAIIDQYGRTPSGNLAKAYAGICYYRLGNPQEAIKRLKSYSGNDTQIAPTMIGLIGDCYITVGETKEGISYFEKAASKADNDLISPIYLKKAGLAYESLQQYDQALKAYRTIKEKYNQSMEAMTIDKYITRVEMLAQKK
ncbi:tol-pal system YbgF family protein [Tannerella sp.]|uniref:tetratricopeptide repeat protein n=1 Tax=Tannerella sp. TaxID=2382127 RepID=UPI0026DA9430|nr:tetratricopeptide repeat protein [Tannerella sp.]MDO4704511.1 tetratricopeptide repeat protein [Tannerella sp.]